MRVDTLAEQMLFTTVPIEAESADESWSGTGFIYLREDPGSAVAGRGVLFLITNRHVLDGAKRLHVTFHASARPNEWGRGRGHRWTLEGVASRIWLGHPDPRVDVAVMPLSAVIFDIERKLGQQPFVKTVRRELAASAADLGQVDAIESVLFIGYPLGLYDPVNLLPIVRRGLTATPMPVDYRGEPAFLIDASVFPGSSGSPVFLYDPGPFTGGRGRFTMGNRLLFVGVVAAVHEHLVEGTLTREASYLIPRVPQPLNLGIVYKSSTVIDLVELAMVQFADQTYG